MKLRYTLGLDIGRSPGLKLMERLFWMTLVIILDDFDTFLNIPENMGPVKRGLNRDWKVIDKEGRKFGGTWILPTLAYVAQPPLENWVSG